MVVIKERGARCACCGATPSDGKTVINVDHIKPRRNYPKLSLEPSNLQVLCNVCNHGKGNWDETDWRRESPELTSRVEERGHVAVATVVDVPAAIVVSSEPIVVICPPGAASQKPLSKWLHPEQQIDTKDRVLRGGDYVPRLVRKASSRWTTSLPTDRSVFDRLAVDAGLAPTDEAYQRWLKVRQRVTGERKIVFINTEAFTEAMRIMSVRVDEVAVAFKAFGQALAAGPIPRDNSR